MTDFPINNPEALLTHGDFVRSLARSLIHDPNRADDVEQETWLAAVRHPPSPEKPPRAWLGAVVKNFARLSRRSESRRLRREQAAALPEEVRSTDEVVEREVMRRSVVEAVLALKEPYRTAILFRFYDDMPPRTIAERLKIPVETVKTRVRRGLEQLRLRLDRSHGGRKAWCLALAPLAGAKLTASAAASTSSAALFSGALAVSTKVKVGIASILIMGASLTLWQLTTKQPESDVTIVMNDGEEGDPDLAKKDVSLNGQVSPPVIETEDDGIARTTVKPSGPFISGRVTNSLTGEPLKAFHLELRRSYPEESPPWKNVLRETVRDKDGRFLIPLERGGTCWLDVRSSRHIWRFFRDLKVPEDAGLADLQVELDPGLSVEGLVLEAETGRPVEGVLIGTTGAGHCWTDPRMIREGFPEYCVHAWTDDKGRFVIEGLQEPSQILFAHHPNFAEASLRIKPAVNSEVELHIEKGACIYGRIFDDMGHPLPGVSVNMSGDTVLGRSAASGPDGRYRTPPAPFNSYVKLRATFRPDGHDAPSRFSDEVKKVYLTDHDVEVDFGPQSEPYVTWCGRVYDVAGEPVGKAKLILRSDRSVPRIGMLYNRTVFCDEQGRFTVNKVRTGAYEVKVVQSSSASTSDSDTWMNFYFEEPGELERDVMLFGSAVRGHVIDGRTGRPLLGSRGSVTIDQRSPGNRRFTALFDENGAFSLGVPPGIYDLYADEYTNVRSSYRLKHIDVNENEIVDDIRLVIPSGGWLDLKVIGLEVKDRFQVYLNRSDASRPTVSRAFHSDHDGKAEEKIYLEEGKWKATFHLGERGVYECAFQITPEETTPLVLNAPSLVFFGGTVTLEATLTRRDGSPVAGAYLMVDPSRVPRKPGDKFRTLRGETDAEGRFSMEGLKPGNWKVWADLPDGASIDFPYLDVPARPEDPFRLDLVLPEGSVKGTFHDARTGLAFDKDGPNWHVHVQEPHIIVSVDGTQFACRDNGKGGSRFDLKGLRAGEFILVLDVAGYFEYRSDRFRFSEGQNLDMGAIPLNPCGVLDLDVVDESGKPVTHYRVYCNGEENTYWMNHWFNRRWDKLPLGDVEVRVSARGYQDEAITVHLEPGKPAEAKVVMEADK